METINIKKIISDNGLDIQEVAQHLFPNNKYPILALNRVIKGDGELRHAQISKLTSLAGTSLKELYSDTYKAKNQDNIVTIQDKDFLAELDLTTFKTKIFHKSSLFFIEDFSADGLTLIGYIKELKQIILNNINK